MVYTANWGIICHLPPFRGTRNNHWRCFVNLAAEKCNKKTHRLHPCFRAVGGMGGWESEESWIASANGYPFKLLGIPYLVGKIQFKLLFHGPKWLSKLRTYNLIHSIVHEYINIHKFTNSIVPRCGQVNSKVFEIYCNWDGSDKCGLNMFKL